MKKILKFGLPALLLLVIGLGVAGYLYRNAAIERVVEQQATKQLNLKTELGSANFALFGGKLDLNQLQIASPPGFQAPEMLTLGEAKLAVTYGQLRQDPVRINGITLDRPKFVLERSDAGFNFKRAIDNMPKGTPPPTGGGGTAPQPPADPAPKPAEPAPSPGPGPADDGSKPVKVIIDDFTVRDAQVVLRPNFPALPPEITINVPTFTMRNIGNADGSQNGAALKDVVAQLMTALAAQAQSSDMIPAELRAILQGDLTAVTAMLGAEAQKRIAAALPGKAGELVGGMLADPNALMKDPGKAVQGAVQGAVQDAAGQLLGGGSTTKPGALPGGLPVDPNKAAENAIGNLLGGGGKKDKEKR